MSFEDVGPGRGAGEAGERRMSHGITPELREQIRVGMAWALGFVDCWLAGLDDERQAGLAQRTKAGARIVVELGIDSSHAVRIVLLDGDARLVLLDASLPPLGTMQ